VSREKPDAGLTPAFIAAGFWRISAMPDVITLTTRAAGEEAGPLGAAMAKTGIAGPEIPRPARKREKFLGFACDEESATVLQSALAPCLPDHNQVHIADFRAALSILAGMPTPEIILVDLSGEDQPINAMVALADVVEAGTTVLAIGEIQNVNFYRTITKGMGVKEYLPKPLTSTAVTQNFLSMINDLHQESLPAPRHGRSLAITGLRGGVGATTIATNLGWFIGMQLHRHTVLLDTELNSGTVALNLNVGVTRGLTTVLETPERVDQLLIERSTQPAGERLHVLASHEALEKEIDLKHGSAELLLKVLQARYNFVIADTGSRLGPLAREMLRLTQQRVVVMDPSVIALRNHEKLLTLAGGTALAPRPMLVLNRAGTPGGLSQHYMEQTMGVPFDAVIPDLPRIVPKTTELGTQAVSLRGPFRTAMASLAATLGATASAETG
jgi:pilus assembly protein CpaE